MKVREELRFQNVSLFLAGKLSRAEAARMCEVSQRTIARWARRIESKGIRGILHGNRGRSPHNKFHAGFEGKIMRLVAERYFDCNMTHALELLRRNHRIVVPYKIFRKWCHERKMVKRRWRKRGTPRFKRDRMASAGLLLQMDGCENTFNGKDTWVLIVAIDDATSEVPYAEFFDGETTLACMKVVEQVVRRRGVPRAVYTDRAGWSGGQKRTQFSQFKRACEELGINVLFAYSPEAKGRIERALQTFQDRLIPELRLQGIKRIEEANNYLKRVFLPKYWNKRNTVAPRDPQSAYRPLDRKLSLREVFCMKYDRTICNDHTFSYKNRRYLIEGPLPLRSLRGHYVEIREYPDDTWEAYFQHFKLRIKGIRADYKPKPRELTYDEWVEDLESRIGLKRARERYPEALKRHEHHMAR